MLNQSSSDQIDFILSQNPIFNAENDGVFSYINRLLKNIDEAQTDLIHSDEVNEWLLDLIFESKSILKIQQEFQGLDLLPKTICGRIIEKRDVYFWCIDCEIHDNLDMIGLICSECFGNSNHEGHRVIMIKNEDNEPAICDCGDKYTLKEENFCKDHRTQTFHIKELLSKFPQKTLEKCSVILLKVIYAIVAIFEMSEALQNEDLSLKIFNLGQSLAKDILTCLTTFYSQFNEVFLILFGTILKEKFQSPFNSIFHNCDDLKREENDHFGAHYYPCKCTILGNLLRLGNIFAKEQQTLLVKFLLDCSKEASFKEFLAVEYTKYSFFFFPRNIESDDYEDSTNSYLTSMVPQLYIREDLRIKVLDSGYFASLIEVIRHVIHNCSEIKRGVFHVISNIETIVFYFIGTNLESFRRILKEENLLQELNHVLAKFQAKFFFKQSALIGLDSQDIQYKKISSCLLVECTIFNILNYAIKFICRNSLTSTLLIKNFLSHWYNDFQPTNARLKKEFTQGNINFNLGLERILSSTIAKFFECSSLQGIEEFINEAIPEFKSQKVSESILANTLRVVGITRYLHSMLNYIDIGPWDTYYYLKNTIFEADIVLIQAMLSIDHSNHLFDNLLDNFFSYEQEISAFFRELKLNENDPDFKKKVCGIESMLHFLIFIMTDELSLLNLTIDNIKFPKNDNENPRLKIIVKKAIINLLLSSEKMSFSHLKKLVHDVLKEENLIDEVLTEVAIYDPQNKKIRIKDEYYSEFDPFIFYKNPLLQRKINKRVSSEVKKNDEADLVSGKFYPDLPECLKSVQKNIYLSELPAFLSLYVTKVPECAICFVAPVLKLLLLNLQVVEQALKNNDDCANHLVHQIKQNYFVPTFLAGLDKMAKRKELEDSRLCIRKIMNLLDDLCEYCDKETSSQTKENAKEYQENRKSNQEPPSKEAKQNKKEEFALRKAIYARNKTLDKYQLLKEYKADETLLNADSIKCECCLERIQKSTEMYGIPLYIAFTNNMYDIEKTEPFGEWWPVVSSCCHFFHKKCFESFNKNTRSNHSYRFVSLTDTETYCPVCWILCNYFVSLNYNDFISFQKDHSMVSSTNETEIYSSLSRGIELLYKSMILKPGLNVDQYPLLPVFEDIFCRAFQYFLEGFHLDSQPYYQQKSFVTYYYFFKSLEADLRRGQLKENYLKTMSVSFLDKVISKVGGINIFTAEKDKMDKIHELQELECEPILQEVFLGNLIEVLINRENLSESLITKRQLSVLKEYFIFKITQMLSSDKIIQLSNVKEIKGFYEKNQVICESILKQLTFPVQKMLLALWMNKSIFLNHLVIPNNLWGLLCQTENDNSELLDILITLIDSSLTLKCLLEEIWNEVDHLPEHPILLLNMLLEFSRVNMELDKPKVIRLVPKMIELPKNYADFVTKYFNIKCSLCNKLSKTMRNSVCLLCDIVLCETHCGATVRSIGNLNKHALTCHLGLGLFVKVQYLRLISISSPLNSALKGKPIYINDFGESVEEVVIELRANGIGDRTVDFKKFTLNKQFVDYIRDTIYHHDMAKVAFKSESVGRRFAFGYY